MALELWEDKSRKRKLGELTIFSLLTMTCDKNCFCCVENRMQDFLIVFFIGSMEMKLGHFIVSFITGRQLWVGGLTWRNENLRALSGVW